MNNELIDYIVKKEISDFREQLAEKLNIQSLVECASKLPFICSEESAKQALSMAMQARKLEKTLDKSRLEITKPHLDYQRAINKLAKDFENTLHRIQEGLQSKIETWMRQQSENAFTKVDKIEVEDGSIYEKEIWSFTILDEKVVPREYLEVDVSSVEYAIKNGIRNINGLNISKIKKTEMRIKNWEQEHE
jgi:hypothetical protein